MARKAECLASSLVLQKGYLPANRFFSRISPTRGKRQPTLHLRPVDLAQTGGEIICQKDAFLCAAKGTKLSIAFSRKLGAGFFGGEGFILQSLEGDGKVFLHAGGTVVARQLDGEKLRVDTGCLVAFEAGIDYDIELSGGLKSMMFGGEGLFLATLEGHGKVWLQSLPFARLADRVLENAVHLKRKGES